MGKEGPSIKSADIDGSKAPEANWRIATGIGGFGLAAILWSQKQYPAACVVGLVSLNLTLTGLGIRLRS